MDPHAGRALVPLAMSQTLTSRGDTFTIGRVRPEELGVAIQGPSGC